MSPLRKVKKARHYKKCFSEWALNSNIKPIAVSKKKNRKLISKNLSPENYIKNRGRNLPIYECLVNENWQEAGIAQIVIARQHSNGNLTIGIYLVDVFCLGVKGSFYQFNISVKTYLEIIEKIAGEVAFIKTDYTLVHNIIYGSIEYAEDFGFSPHRDFEKITSYLLEDDDEQIDLLDIEFGFEGKPFLLVTDEQEPYKKYLTILDKTAGPDNYNFSLPSGEATEEIDELEDTDVMFSNPPYTFLEPKIFDDETEAIIDNELLEYEDSDDEQGNNIAEQEIELHTETNIRMLELFFPSMFPEEEVQEAYDFGLDLFDGIELNEEAEFDEEEKLPDEFDMKLLLRAHEDIKAKKPKNALIIAKQLLAKYPNNSSLLIATHICYNALNKPRKAEDVILYSYQRFPKNISIRSYYFLYLMNKKKYDKIEKLLATTGSTIKDVNPNKFSYSPNSVFGYYQALTIFFLNTNQLLKAKAILYQLNIHRMNQMMYDSLYEFYLQSMRNFYEELEKKLRNDDE